MRRSKKPIIIASRRSRLAQVQAELVGGAINRLHPRINVEYLWIESDGDQSVRFSLAGAGVKGLFTRAVDQAVLDGQADLAVHSMKDLPTEPRVGMTLAAVLSRGEVRDCLIAGEGIHSISDLPHQAVVGTSSLRRAAQLLRLREDLQIEPLAGNVETRINKVLGSDTEKRYEATVLAAAGLRRIGMDQYLRGIIDLDQIMPASCQGAIAIQCRADDHVTLTRTLPLNDPATATAVHAEREVINLLGADCHSPIAVLAQPAASPEKVVQRNADAHWFRLRIRVLSPDGRQCIESDKCVKTKELRHLIKKEVAKLNNQGADRILAESRVSGLSRGMNTTASAGS